MNKVYDNGALLIGNIDNVIKAVKNDIKNDIDMLFISKNELLEELEELKEELGKDLIVYIDYESNRTEYELNYWTNEDIVE